MSSSEAVPQARVVVQQCLSARLQVKPPSQENEAEYVEVGRGIIIYICFLKGSTEDLVEKMVRSTLGVRLSESEPNGKLVSVLDLPGDVLIVPQATLGGKTKGKAMQYHSNIAKTEGQELYTKFCTMCAETFETSTKTKEANKTVKHGTYGNRQVLTVVTNGPYTHVLDF
ncbi:D-aminoacyl-tRNA deacylase 2-like [Branchiostoma lanceolatum]|uniref:D-aminoacyl-tRNA deacylase 2-like n=1 Tax=Branchiostoma lanceolatum TaxID=7740 RepID=UPI00345615A0